jgi:hypothetical protein
MVDKKHIITLQGNDYVTHAGLLAEAHKDGLKSIITEIVRMKEDSDQVVIKATVTMYTLENEYPERIFTAYGDADNKNTNANILPHKIRMAETRAINRALRFATNIGMCSVEELGDNKKVQPTKKKIEYKCTSCEKAITEKVAKYSDNKLGQALCMGCQGNKNDQN